MDNPNLNFEEVDKPWGAYRRFTLNTQSTVKILTVNPGQKFSLQYHHNREEFWRILPGGTALITLGDEVIEAEPGKEILIPKETNHRAEAKDEVVYILEIAFGEFDEEDIVRLQDDYGRV